MTFLHIVPFFKLKIVFKTNCFFKLKNENRVCSCIQMFLQSINYNQFKAFFTIKR